jgi:hypothetical protein
MFAGSPINAIMEMQQSFGKTNSDYTGLHSKKTNRYEHSAYKSHI